MSTISLGVIGAIIVGLVEVAKRLGVNPKFSPLLAVLLGIGFTAISGYSWSTVIIDGIIIGLIAVGLYSGTTNTVEAIKGK